MSATPRTDEFWHERGDGVYPNKTVDSVIAFCRQLERDYVALEQAHEIVKKDCYNLTEKVIPNIQAECDELAEALQPFARFACDEPCCCHNCKARAILAKINTGTDVRFAE